MITRYQKIVLKLLLAILWCQTWRNSSKAKEFSKLITQAEKEIECG